jgi:GH24 family phage-related lysozyme (muramidase)
MAANKHAVTLIQYALNRQGFEAGSEDGIWGKNSQRAFNEYIKSKKGGRPEDNPDNGSDGDLREGGMVISSKALDLIIESETGGEEYYRKYLSKPTWPGGASGVTIGVGFDLGYNSAHDIKNAWWGVIPEQRLVKLFRASGVKGSAAKHLTKEMQREIVPITWEQAISVFKKNTLPRFIRLTKNTFKGIENLHPVIQGVMLSIVFNRGGSTSGPRRREMLNIQTAIRNGNLSRIPQEIRSMKRLWEGRGLDGLLKRRDAEAALIESIL